MKLSVVILCHNEFGMIGRIVQAVRSGPIEDVQMIIVDDCSTDGIRDLLQSLNIGSIRSFIILKIAAKARHSAPDSRRPQARLISEPAAL